MCRPTVFLVDADADARARLESHLREAGFDVQPFEGPRRFLRGCPTNPAGCVLLTPSIAGPEADELQQSIHSRGWTIPVIVTVGPDATAVAVRAHEAGAFAVLAAPTDPEVLCERVGQALDHDCVTRQALAQRADALMTLERLSSREQEVMSRLVRGQATKEIAAALEVSPRTVEKHRARVMQKTRVGSLAELVVLAARAGELEITGAAPPPRPAHRSVETNSDDRTR